MNATVERKGRVLVVEDHPVNQRVAAAMLEHLGYDVDVVGDGAEAVKAAIATRYQYVLMDCQLPDVDGFEAAVAIRSAERAGNRIPIIAVSGSVMNVDRERCIAAGMNDYLTKPLSIDSLAAVLGRWASYGSGEAVTSDGPDVVSAPVEPEPPVLDAEVVARLEFLGKAAGVDLIGQLAVLFLADAEVRVASLRVALTARDAVAVVQAAHTLSGASANLGATELSRMCATLAVPGAVGDLVARMAMVDSVEAELERVRCALAAPAVASQAWVQ